MKKQKKGKVIIKIILYLILALFISLTCAVSIKPFGIAVNDARFGVYGCLDGGGIIPDGSLVITDKMSYIQDGCKIAVYGDFSSNSYPEDMQHIIVGYAAIDGNRINLKQIDDTKFEVSIDQVETISWRIDVLGTLMFFLYSFKYILWTVWGIVVALIIVLEATAPTRRHNRYKKELIKTFNFYGEKYTAEDSERDY